MTSYLIHCAQHTVKPFFNAVWVCNEIVIFYIVNLSQNWWSPSLALIHYISSVQQHFANEEPQQDYTSSVQKLITPMSSLHNPLHEAPLFYIYILAAQQFWAFTTGVFISKCFFVGERSGLQKGQFSTWTVLLLSHAVVTDAVCGLAFSPWNVQGLHEMLFGWEQMLL